MSGRCRRHSAAVQYSTTSGQATPVASGPHHNLDCFRRVEMAHLFAPDLPDGFRYQEDFISPDQERMLLDAIGELAFAEFKMRGVVARRRVAFFGESYD